MAGALIEIEVDDSEIGQALDRLLAKTGNLAPAMKNIGEYLQRSTWERFFAQKDPAGHPWAPLKPSTLLRKTGSHILIEKGERGGLLGSIHYEASPGEVLVGTNVKYAAIHQFGGKTRPHEIRPRRKKALAWPGGAHPVKVVKHPGSEIPARPFLGLSEEDRQEVLLILSDHLGQA